MMTTDVEIIEKKIKNILEGYLRKDISKSILNEIIYQCNEIISEHDAVDYVKVIITTAWSKANILEKVKAFINGAEESLRMNPALITPVLELEYLKALLPQQLSAEKLKEVVDQILSTVDASVTGGKLVGVVMGQLKKDYPNQFDATLVCTMLP